jgi:AAA domain-containing protein
MGVRPPLSRRSGVGDIADGGVGKSSLALSEAIAMVTGRALLDITPNKETFEDGGLRDGREVLYYNAEESRAEIQRRVAAICQHFEIDLKELDRPGSNNPWRPPASLRIVSGHDFPLVLAKSDGDGFTFSNHIEFLEGFEGDVIILDPFVSLHQCPENDNSMIDAIVKRLGRVAATPPIKAIELVHHARKPAHGGTLELSAADARGASALGDGVRSLRMLNRMTATEALRAKIDDHRNFFRVDASKANYAAPSTSSQWFRHKSVILGNGDDVGVIVPWHFPGAFDGITPAHMHQVRELTRGGEYRAHHQSSDWIGHAIADVLDLDPESDGDRKRIRTILKEWFTKGVLKRVERPGRDRHRVTYVEPGEWTES